MNKPDTAVSLGFEAVRYLSQTAEACSLYALEQGHDAELVTISVHCSDRAEHVAQYFLEAPDKRWPLDSVLDDVTWLCEIDRHMERVRNKVVRSLPSRADLGQLAERIKTCLALDSEASTDDSAEGLKGGALHDLPNFISPNGYVKPYTLEQIANMQPLIIGNPPKPDSHYQPLSEAFFALNKRDFASLSQLEAARFWALKHAGSHFGLMVEVCVVHDSEEIQAALAAASPKQQEEIYRSVLTEIHVRWAAIDSQPSAGRRALLADSESKGVTNDND